VKSITKPTKVPIKTTLKKFLKKDHLKFLKIKNIYEKASNKKDVGNRPPKMGILILITILKFSKSKNT